MHGELFESTLPVGEPELLRASGFRTYLDELDADTAPSGASSRISSLSPTLQTDLQRFEQGGGTTESVEVIAACLRHSKPVTIYFQCDDKVIPLTVFPQERLVHCPVDMPVLIERYLPLLRVMHVEPAILRPPSDPQSALVGEARLYHPLGPLVWGLAMQGSRRELLPEISGSAAYRVAPGLDDDDLPVSGVMRVTIQRLRRRTANLNEISSWPDLNRERAARLLNALYLLTGLIVSRAHPNALRETWFGGR